MPKVWTRKRAGTESSSSVPSAPAAAIVRNPVPDRPEIHQIELPLAWETAASTILGSPDAAQVYLVESDPLTLIDTGVRTPDSRAALEGALERLGYGFADIERVVITHAHRDHFGLVQTLRSAGAEIECCVHEADADLVEDHSRLVRERVEGLADLLGEFGVPESFDGRMRMGLARELDLDATEAEGTRVDRRLRDGDRIEWKDWGLGVLHSPGHTPGHILLEDAEAGLLFTGDQIMAQAMPRAENFYLDAMANPGDPLRRRPRFRGLVEMRKSLRRLRGRRDRILLPGYGAAIRRADRTIRDTLLYYDVRIQRIDRGLRHLAAIGQDVTAFEIWKALFPPGEAGLARGEQAFDALRAQMLLVIGALDCLEEDGLLVTDRRADGVFTHHHR